MTERDQIERDTAATVKPLRLLCLGSSDAFNSGGRANSCYWVDDADGSYLIDCGPTTTQALKREAQQLSLASLDTIYVTHLHGDHINGLPVLLLELNFGQKRQRPLKIIGPPTTQARLKMLCEVSYPTMLTALISYEIEFQEHPLDFEGMLGHRQLKSIAALHDPTAYPTSLRITDSSGHALVFSGDTGWNPKLIDLSAQVDIFVLECSYATSLFSGHVSLDEIIKVRSRLTPTQLILTHLGVESRAAALNIQDDLNVHVADDGAKWLIGSTVS